MGSNPSLIDLILMDINLGSGMDGTQAAEQILRTNDIPILFLSSHTEPNMAWTSRHSTTRLGFTPPVISSYNFRGTKTAERHVQVYAALYLLQDVQADAVALPLAN